MSKRSFAVGDRVAVYGLFACSEGGTPRWLDGDRGRVVSIDEQGLTIDLDVPMYEPYTKNPQRIDSVHPKQCRLLKPRPARRRVWVSRATLNAMYPAMPNGPDAACRLIYTGDQADDDLVEFIEVRRPARRKKS